MKRILIILLGLFSVAYGQFSPTSAKQAFKWGVSIGTRDSTAYAANDSLVVVINRQGRMMYRSTDGYWKILSNAAASDYVPYTGAVASVNIGEFRLSSRSVATDSILARSSAGGRVVSNSGTSIATYGAGGGSEFVFNGFAGYNSNRSGSFTDLSFVNKKWADSLLALKLNISDSSIYFSQVVRTFGNQTVGGNKTFTNDITINGITAGRAGGSLIGTTAFGNGALANNTTGYENTAFGYQALNVVDTGFRNAAFGWKALSKNLARYNSAFGFSALELNTTGNSNTGIGVNALRDNTTGGLNTAVGHDALEYNTTASNNTALGYRTLVLNTTGAANTGVGSRSLYYNETGSNNTAVGYGTLDSNRTGFGNIAMGYEALKQQRTGLYNTAIGYTALFENDGGSTNMALGFQAMKNNITGSNNNAIGASSLFTNTTGNNNTALGHLTLYNATGARNIALGNFAGFYATGSDEFFVNHRDRSSYEGDTSLGLMYGKMDVLTALQRLRINGNLIVSGGATFGGRAGYNRSNYSSMLTDSSFTHKKYVDSLIARKIDTGSVRGAGNYIPKYTAATVIGNSQLFDNGTNLGLGTASPTEFFHVQKNQNASTRILVTNTDVTSTASRATLRTTSGTVTTDFSSISGLASLIGSVSNHDVLLMSNNTTRATLKNSGRFLLNQTIDNGSSIFQMTGDANILGTLNVDGNITATTGTTTGTFRSSQSYRVTGQSGGWDYRYGFFGSAGTDRGGFGAFGGTDDVSKFYIGQSNSDNIAEFNTTTKQSTFNGVVSATQGLVSLSGVTGARGRLTSLFLNKDSVPITTSNVMGLTIDTTTGRINREETSGSYTPTITGVTNVASSTTNVCFWSKAGRMVTVTGYLEIDPTAASTATEFRLSLPIATSFTGGNSGKVAGTMVGLDGAASGSILADIAGNRASFRYTTPASAANMGLSFTFSYLIE